MKLLFVRVQNSLEREYPSAFNLQDELSMIDETFINSIKDCDIFIKV